MVYSMSAKSGFEHKTVAFRPLVTGVLQTLEYLKVKPLPFRKLRQECHMPRPFHCKLEQA